MEFNKSLSDSSTSVFSRTGYVVKYANCPIMWMSKLQTEISLSTTESEYIAFSQSLRKVIPMMALLEELKGILPLHAKRPKLNCAIFEEQQ